MNYSDEDILNPGNERGTTSVFGNKTCFGFLEAAARDVNEPKRTLFTVDGAGWIQEWNNYGHIQKWQTSQCEDTVDQTEGGFIILHTKT